MTVLWRAVRDGSTGPQVVGLVVEDGQVITAPPLIRWAKGQRLVNVARALAAQGWRVELVEQSGGAPPHEQPLLPGIA